ncbi:Tetratricopeptide repeat protein 37, partial [Desmophyllum pertusum]
MPGRFLADVQANQGSPMAAELCYRQCLQAGMDSKAQSWRVCSSHKTGNVSCTLSTEYVFVVKRAMCIVLASRNFTRQWAGQFKKTNTPQLSESADRDRWINLSLEASNEVLKLKCGFSAAYLIQGIVYYLQDNARASRRAFQHVIDSDTGGSAIAQYWLLLLHLKKNDLPAAM